MSVLGREQDSYQRALEAYQRQVNRHNRGVDKYKATLVKDNSGNLLVIDGSGNVSAVNSGGALIGAALPRGFDVTSYGATDIPGGQGYRQLRQGEPTEQRTETKTGLRRYDGDYGPYYVDSDWNTVPLGNDWKITLTTPAQDYGDNYSPALYTATRNASTYMSAPAEWDKEFNRRAPSATPGQAAKIGAPSLAEVEGGLVGEVMKGRGVRYGVPVYRPKGDA